ncbi:MAG: hypothetical protein GTN78_09265, partial [Gemmatimonadales bacterium]|nr:hypothetical protein [Gemmatimonadales bacterium]
PYLANAMADMLWNRKQSRAQHRRRLMEAAFGKHAAKVEAYLGHLVRAARAGPSYVHRSLIEKGLGSREKLLDLAAFAGKHRRRFGELAKRTKDRVVRTSLELLAIHADHADRIARAHIA